MNGVWNFLAYTHTRCNLVFSHINICDDNCDSIYCAALVENIEPATFINTPGKKYVRSVGRVTVDLYIL